MGTQIIGQDGRVSAQCRCPGPRHGGPLSVTTVTDITPAPEPPAYEGYVVAGQRTPYKCPICEGRGRVDRDFYGETMNASQLIVCQSCHGTGVLWGP